MAGGNGREALEKTETEPYDLVVLPAGLFNDVLEQLPCVGAAYGRDATGWRAWLRADPADTSLVRTDGSQAYWLVASAASLHARCAGEVRAPGVERLKRRRLRLELG